jgi:isopentenyl phosphate kinase
MLTSHIFVKLGGSVLTDKTRPEAVDAAALAETTRALAAFAQETGGRLLIGHGGGSFGHYWAERYATHQGAHDATEWYGFARVLDAMGRLNRMVVGALLEAGLPAVGVQPSASALAAAGRLEALDHMTLERMLAAGLTPVIYGDGVLDREQGAAIASTEQLFGFLAPRLRPIRIVLIGESGVWTADPRRDPAATRIPLITGANIATVLTQTGASHGTDVTGGMAAKVAAMWELVQQTPGLEIRLVGIEPGAIRSALEGIPAESGTTLRLA